MEQKIKNDMEIGFRLGTAPFSNSWIILII